jgi:hypothetical protein
MHSKPIRRRANMRRVGLVIGTVALLAAACGAFAQTTFTWQGSCGTQGWYDICAIGTCENNNAYTLRQNNWGSVRCSSDGSPAFPWFRRHGDYSVGLHGADKWECDCWSDCGTTRCDADMGIGRPDCRRVGERGHFGVGKRRCPVFWWHSGQSGHLAQDDGVYGGA